MRCGFVLERPGGSLAGAVTSAPPRRNVELNGLRARESRYRLAQVPDAGAVREALDAALGTVATVVKRRRVLLGELLRLGFGARELPA